MKLCIFNDYRVGVVDGDSLRDVTAAVPGHQGRASSFFWVEMCRDFEQIRPTLADAAKTAPGLPLDQVKLHAPVLNPPKIIAAASNYSDHVTEMQSRVDMTWMLDFDIFLKAPSSVLDPFGEIRLPPVRDREAHHEVELAVVIGRTGADIPEEEALEYILGYTILLDITVRGKGDRSRRKSYDTFSPIGPWLVTADDIADPHDLDLKLWVNEDLRQDANTNHLLVSIPGMISYASSIMTLQPGDVFSTGTPAGVGPINPGDSIRATIEGIGTLRVSVGERQPPLSR